MDMEIEMMQAWDEYSGDEGDSAVHPMFEAAFKAGWQADEIERLRKQRDELLTACELAEPVMETYAAPTRLAGFMAAIASVKRAE